MMAGPPPSEGGMGGDEPIHCFYCKEETTMGKVVASPDGHPCCKGCMKDFMHPSEQNTESLR